MVEKQLKQEVYEALQADLLEHSCGSATAAMSSFGSWKGNAEST